MKQRQPARGRGRGAGLARAQDMDQRQAPAPALVETAPELEAGNAAMAEEASVEVAATPQEIATPILDQVAANLESGGEGGGGDGEDALVAGAYLD